MELAAQLAVLAAATIFAAGVALGMAWALLRGAFHLMRPAVARPTVRPVRSDLVHGTRAVATQFALYR